MNTRIAWIIPIFALLFASCQETSKEGTTDKVNPSKPLQTPIQKSASPAKRPTITHATPQQPKGAAASLGITVDDGKIIIDTRQTKDFLHGIGEKMKRSFKKIESTLQKEKISSPNETGIIINDTSMQIDLNKTKNFMEKWMRSMESVVNELNKTMDEIKRSLPQR